MMLARRERAAQAIRAAVEAMDERGWKQHTITGPDGSLCARGALNYALTGITSVAPFTEPFAVRMVAEAAILDARRFSFRSMTLPKWNDSRWQSYPRVRRTMLRAADRLGR